MNVNHEMIEGRPARRSHRVHRALIVGVVLAMLAGACSKVPDNRGAVGGASDPVQLPPLAGVDVGTGDRSPVFTGSIVTPSNGIATSLSPTLSVPGATGAWKFVISDVSGGKGGFTRTYDAAGSSVRVPLGAGLKQGNVYSWTGTGPGDRVEGGTFFVDVQNLAAQDSDSFGPLDVELSSGEAAIGWASHAMTGLPGAVNFQLRFLGSNPSEQGMPSGWQFQATSGSPVSFLDVRADGTVGVNLTNGAIVNYQETADSWRPVLLSGTRQVTGSAPVLSQNADGSWTVTAKQTTSVFGAADPATGRSTLVSVDSPGRPVYSQKWSEGLLRSVIDPVSGREVTFQYGGGDCPKVVDGFVAAPIGMLCGVSFWDGSTSSIGYVRTPTGETSIGRLVDNPEAAGNGAAVTDLAYDRIGRVARIRSSLVAAAIAAGVVEDEAQYLTEISYDEQGRVVGVVDSAPSAGAVRSAHTYDHSSNRSTTVIDANRNVRLVTDDFDPSTFLVTSSTDSYGLTSTNEWDYATGNLLKAVDPNGNVTVNTYVDGQLATTAGPTAGSLATDGPLLRYGYDETFESSPDGTPMRGLDVTYWGNAEWLGASDGVELGPKTDGRLAPSLNVNWADSPTGSGSWSARMTGVVEIAKQGNYTFTAGGSAQAWIDNVSCAANGCTAMPLSDGRHVVRVDVASTNTSGSMNLTYSGPDTGGQPIAVPTSVLAPAYGFATSSRSADALAAGAPSEMTTRSTYDNPADGQVTQRVNQSSHVSRLGYEPAGARGKWGRQTTATQPGGNSVAFEYWGNRESAASKCPGAKSANQGGLGKVAATPGADGGKGPSSTTWFDAAGRIAATALSDGATTCFAYDRAGRSIGSEQIGMGEKRVSTTDLVVDGNPLIQETVTIIGAQTLVQRTEIDLAGRIVRVIDPYGVISVTTYVAGTADVESVTTTVPGAAPVVESATYESAGRQKSYAVDGRVLATVEYASNGNIAGVNYGSGVKLVDDYDSSNRLVGLTWTTTDGHTYSSKRTLDRSSRALGASWSLDGRASTMNYRYDDSRRLAAATLSAGLSAAKSWAYGYDSNSNRTSLAVDGATYTSTYDAADRLVSSTDPALVGGVTYDARYNATKVGTDSFTFDKADNLQSATDGTSTVSYVRDVGGGVISKTVTDGAGTRTTKNSLNGVVLDGDGRPLVMVIDLAGGATFTKSFGGVSQWEYTELGGNRFWSSDDAGVAEGSPRLFDPFGGEIAGSGTRPVGAPSTSWQSINGLETESLSVPYVMMGARVYVSSIGRFIQLDPQLGSGANGYDYVNQDPVNSADPSGQAFSDWIPIIVTAVIAIGLTVATGGLSNLSLPAVLAVGVVEGAALGAIGYAVQFGVESAQGKPVEWSTSAFLTEVGIGAALGLLGAGVGRYAKVRNLKVKETRIESALSLTNKGIIDELGPAVDNVARVNRLMDQTVKSIRINKNSILRGTASHAAEARTALRENKIFLQQLKDWKAFARENATPLLKVQGADKRYIEKFFATR